MVAKYWKKFLLIVLIIACIFNIISKIVRGTQMGDQLQASAKVEMQERNNNQTQVK